MKIIVAVTGATGVEMSYYLLQSLRAAKCQTYLIVSRGAALTWKQEGSRPLEELFELADHVYAEEEMTAPIASGSFCTDGMIVMPCSMKTLAGIVTGYGENLILRSADVCLKEGRRVVLVPRETPLSRIHLRNMKEAAELGCMLVPPMLTFYHGAGTVEDQIWHIVGKVLMPFGIPCEHFHPWEGGKSYEFDCLE